MKRVPFFVLLLSSIGVLFYTDAFPLTGDEAVRNFQKRMRNIGTVKGEIKWTDQTGMLYTADFRYKSPGKIFVKIKSPNEKLFISDGTQLWVYDTRQNICGIQDLLKQGSGGIAALIYGYMALVKENESGYTIRLKNKERRYHEITLMVDSSFFLQEILIKTNLGKHINFSLSNVKIGSEIKDDIFQFIIPKTTQVVKNPLNY